MFTPKHKRCLKEINACLILKKYVHEKFIAIGNILHLYLKINLYYRKRHWRLHILIHNKNELNRYLNQRHVFRQDLHFSDWSLDGNPCFCDVTADLIGNNHADRTNPKIVVG